MYPFCSQRAGPMTFHRGDSHPQNPAARMYLGQERAACGRGSLPLPKRSSKPERGRRQGLPRPSCQSRSRPQAARRERGGFQARRRREPRPEAGPTWCRALVPRSAARHQGRSDPAGETKRRVLPSRRPRGFRLSGSSEVRRLAHALRSGFQALAGGPQGRGQGQSRPRPASSLPKARRRLTHAPTRARARESRPKESPGTRSGDCELAGRRPGVAGIRVP